MDLWYWLINHGVSRHDINKKPTAFLFDLYKQKNSQTNKRKAVLDLDKRQSWPVNQFPDLSQFADLKPLKQKDGRVPLRKDPDKIAKSFTVSLSPGFPARDLQPFTRATVHWGKGNNQTFQGLFDAGPELTLIPRDPKKHWPSS